MAQPRAATSQRLRIEIVKRTDGRTVLRCTRADGSVTWQRLGGAQVGFFPMHDLTHVAVEQSLGATQAFFGLVAIGWDIEETTGMGSHGPLPEEARFVERLVGMLDVERGTGSRWTAEAFATQIAAADPRLAARAEAFTDMQLDAIRARRADLFQRWNDVKPGEALVLEY
jgi:hypothetical protein